MLAAARHCARTLLRVTALFALTTFARAQCLDWVPGFGTPGFGANFPARALTVFDDGMGPAIYAGGDFNSIGGVSTAVGRWNGAGWSAVGPAFESGINAFAAYDDGTGSALYIGGYFSTANGAPANAFARWTGSAWTPIGGGIIGNIRAMAVFNDGSGPAIYVAGAFTTVGGSTSASRIARWDGSSWSALSTGLNGEAYALAVHDDGSGPALYVAGYFTSAGGVTAIHVARWNGTTWSALGSGLAGSNAGVFTLLSYNGGLYAGGLFQVSGSTNVKNVAKWNGSTWSPLGNGLNDAVQCLSHFDDGTGDALYAGGAFTASGAQLANRIAKWSGSAWSPLGTGLNSNVSGATAYGMLGFDDGSGSKLFVAGSLTTAGDKPSMNIAEWGIPCYAPVITAQPASTTAVFAQNIVFHVEANGTAPVTYQWRKNGAPLSDTTQITGSQTATLTLHYFSFSDGGGYDCVVSNSLGTVTSDLAVLTIPAGGNTGLPVAVSPVVVPPESIPNDPGHTYSFVYDAVQSSTGDVAFEALLDQTNPNGVHSLNLWQDNAAALLYGQGDPAPGTASGVVFATTSTYQVHANGAVAFYGTLSGPGVSGTNLGGIWYQDASGVDLIIRMGDQAPGMTSGMTLGSIINNQVSAADGGTVVFMANALMGTTFQWLGVWSWTRANGLQLVTRSNAPAPGTSSNFSGFMRPQVAPNGDVYLVGATPNEAGLWSGQPGAIQLIAKSGDAAPGMPAGSVFSDFPASVLIDDQGEAAIQTKVLGTDNVQRFVVYRINQGALNLIVAAGQPAPGADASATFFIPQRAALNDHNPLINSGLSTGCQPPCVTSGLWLTDATNPPVIVAANSFAFPEIPSGWDFGGFQTAALDASDQVVFQCMFFHGSSYRAVFGWTALAGVFPIAVPGSQFQVNPGDVRTVEDATLSPLDGNTSGGIASSSLTDAGRVVLRVMFTDTSTGVFFGQFTDFQSLYVAPGSTMCPGDGTAGSCPCGNSGLPGRGCNNSASTGGAQLTSSGGASLSDDSVVLTSHGELPNALSIFLQGKQATAAAPFGDGLRCITGSLKRIAVRNAHAGVVSYPGAGDPSISFRSAQLGDQIVASTVRYYQTYYRDPALSFCPAPVGNSWNVSSGEQILWYP